MPRLTPLRLLKLVSLPWIVLVGLWVTLPSPSVPARQREAYIKDRLARGKTVITAIDGYKDTEWCDFACQTILPHWKVVSTDHDTLLHLSDWDDNGAINITKYVSDAKDFNSKMINWPTAPWLPFFSPTLKLDSIPVGDEDEEVNMPWFHPTDKKLWEYNMHNTNARIKVRVVLPEPGTVEIWSNKFVDENFEAATNHTLKELTGEFVENVAYEYMLQNEGTNLFLASLKIVEGWNGDQVVVKGLTGRLASRTYWIRKSILFFLAPFLMIISFPYYYLIYPIIEVMGPLFPFIFIWMSCLVALVVYRRMLERGPISSRFGGLIRVWNSVTHMARRITWRGGEERSIWGPAGPVAVKTHRQWFDEEKSIGLQKPVPIRPGARGRD